jgi:hypothetical protein
MTRGALLSLALLGALACGSRYITAQRAGGTAPPPEPSAEGQVDTRGLIRRLESVVGAGDPAAYLALMNSSADAEQARDFAAAEIRPGATRVVIQERDRARIVRSGVPTDHYRFVLDVFVEQGARARASTWQIEAETRDGRWWLETQNRLSNVDRLYRLSVSRARQYDARNFVVSAEDFDLTLAEGSVFTIDTDEGTTGLVLIGRGEMSFRPAPDTEKGQVRIFAGDTSCVSRFDAAYIRFGAASLHTDMASLQERPVDAQQLRRAERVFREESVKSYSLDLGDLSRDQWSLTPSAGDFLAEVRTRRYGTLTYARAEAEAEDISFFDRRRQRQIALYASTTKLERRGRFYNEDELALYDVVHYDIDLTMYPDRLWLEGETTMRLRVALNGTNQLNIRLADSLVVRSIVSDRFGRLFGLRVKGQNSLLVSLPAFAMPGTDLSLTIVYAGRLEPQPPDRETVGIQQEPGTQSRYQPSLWDLGDLREPSFLYSSRSYWYPQAPVSDYATARMHVTVPSPYGCMASGRPAEGGPQLVSAVGSRPGRLFRFIAERPVRYLSLLVSRFEPSASTTIAFDEQEPPPPAEARAESRSMMIARSAPQSMVDARTSPPYRELEVHVEANPRQVGKGRELVADVTDIATFYQSIIGDIPYASFTLAVTEHLTPGGHAPGYFAAVYQTLPGAPITWQNDPAAFDGYPEFFLAHEMAHQWWGQAVGWSNYHEQWLSEGFAQYFAALYAHHRRGDEAFASVLRHMRKWSLDVSDQGPIHLGYRLGHIKNEGRIFRALVYNKGGAVLHMLRRLVGDDAFFRAIRRYYSEWRYRKPATDDLRIAVEAEAGRSLERFFERWIYGASLPRLTYSYRVVEDEADAYLALKVDQAGELFDVPVSFTVSYSDRPASTILVPVTERVVEARFPLDGTLRDVSPSRNDGTLAEPTHVP